jgi:hypothetical protein
MYNVCMRKSLDIFMLAVSLFILSMGIIGICNYRQTEGLVLGIIAVVASIVWLLSIVVKYMKGRQYGFKKVH